MSTNFVTGRCFEVLLTRALPVSNGIVRVFGLGLLETTRPRGNCGSVTTAAPDKRVDSVAFPGAQKTFAQWQMRIKADALARGRHRSRGKSSLLRESTNLGPDGCIGHTSRERSRSDYQEENYMKITVC